jgi:hypothetical protein
MFVLRLHTVLSVRHVMAQLVEALRYKPKVVGLILNGVIGIYHLNNPSGHTMALGLTQPPTEMSTRGISWGIKLAGA